MGDELGPVGEPGEGVVTCLVDDGVRHLLYVGEVSEGDCQALEGGSAADCCHGAVDVDLCPLFVFQIHVLEEESRLILALRVLSANLHPQLGVVVEELEYLAEG